MHSKTKIVLVTGGFDPIHSGHIKYFEEAKKLGDYLVVGLNSDKWLKNKKGKPFLPFFERNIIIKNLKMIDEVISWDDSDGSAIGAISKVLKKYPSSTLIFANGGDRTKINIPELKRYKNNKSLVFAFGVGGSKKINSSSKILNNWKD